MIIRKVLKKDLKVIAKNKLYFSFFETELGEMIIASIDNKLVELNFVQDRTKSISELRRRFPSIEILEEHNSEEELYNKIFKNQDPNIEILLIGSEFQIKVWEAIYRLGRDKYTTYKEIAKEIKNPQAIQAVGSAVGANPIAILIPCHNVIKTNGDIGEYKWGRQKKIEIIEWERSKKEKNVKIQN